MFAINGYLLGLSFPAGFYYGSWYEILCNVLMWGSVILTAWSGLDYFMHCWPYVKGQN
jgi:phosphatidylglycerophosphate synthase